MNQIKLLEELIELCEEIIQEERYSGTPIAVNKIISYLKGRIEELKKDEDKK